MALMQSASQGWVTTDVKLTGKTVLITGANSGIGLETAIDLARRDARVILACRSVERGGNAKRRVTAESGNQNVVVKQLDLASFDSIRNFAEDFNRTEERLDVLINNAGVLTAGYRETANGFELHFGVNHLGHFLLTNLLMDLLKRSAPSRVVTVTSDAHEGIAINWEDPNRKKGYVSLHSYGQSKLMNILFTRELARRLTGKGVTSYSVHPGMVQTEIGRDLDINCSNGFISCCVACVMSCKCMQVTPEQGAQTSIYCSVAPELANESGKYYADCKIAREHNCARSDSDAKRLWEMSEKLCEIQTSI